MGSHVFELDIVVPNDFDERKLHHKGRVESTRAEDVPSPSALACLDVALRELLEIAHQACLPRPQNGKKGWRSVNLEALVG